MKRRSIVQFMLAATTAFTLLIPSTDSSAAPVADGAIGGFARSDIKQAAVKQTRARMRVIRQNHPGLVRFDGPIPAAPTTYYWYRPTVVATGRPAKRQKVYLLSPEPKLSSDAGWHCCIMLGIAY